MDSNELLKRGFELFGEFNLSDFKDDKNILNITGIYIFYLEKEFSRLLGATDILYLGQSGGAKNGRGRPIFERLVDYCRGAESAPQDKRIHDALENINQELGQKIFVLYKEINKENCSKEEQNLLREFGEEHLELPPLNRQGGK